MDCSVVISNKFWNENRCNQEYSKNGVKNPYWNYWNREKFCGWSCYQTGHGYDEYPYNKCCNDDANACTLDTKKCCNGDVVGRTGPNCKW